MKTANMRDRDRLIEAVSEIREFVNQYEYVSNEIHKALNLLEVSPEVVFWEPEEESI